MNETRTDATDDVRRGALYRGLAMGLDRPDEEFARSLRSGTYGAELVAAAEGLGDETIADDAHEVADAAPADADHLPFGDTFGVEGEDVVGLYEVAYSPGTLVTETNRLADIAGFYGAFGIEIAAGQRERADYLSIQLEFVQYLLLQRSYLLEQGDEEGVAVTTDALGAFLEDHLGRWAPRFAATVRETVDDAFYRARAALLDAVVAADVEWLDVEPDVFEETPQAPLEEITGMERDEEGRLQFSCGAGSGPIDPAAAGEGGEQP